MTAHSPITLSHRASPVLGKAAAVGLLLSVVFTALAHGAVEPWSLAAFEVIIVALVLLCAIKFVADGRLKIYVPSTTLPLVVLVVVGLAQSVTYSSAGGRISSLSMDVEATRTTLVALVCLLLAFVIAANVFGRREDVRSVIWFLVVYGLAMALFALVQHFTWNGRFFWLRPTAAEGSLVFGPFVNRNHFAGYMELLMPLPVALVITRAVRKDARLFFLLAAAAMGVAAVVSLSRGGMVSIAAEMTLIAVFGIGAKRQRGRGVNTLASPGRLRSAALIILVATLISAGILWVGSEPVVSRLLPSQIAGQHSKSETFFSSRGWIWRDSIAMISANPIVGVGLGAYETAYPIYSRDDGSQVLGQSYAVDRAHNDYLQILAEFGVIGAAIALWFIVLVFRAVARGMRNGDQLMAGVALGCGASIFGMLAHSFFDFNLQLPSNALLFLLLTAVASRTSARRTSI